MSTIDSMTSHRESDWIWEADKRARAYDEEAIAQKRPLGFNLTTGTPFKDGKEYKPLAVQAAEEDRARDEEMSTDYLPVAEINRQMVVESINRLLYPGKNVRIATDPTSSSSGAQNRLWYALPKDYHFVQRLGLSASSPIMTFPPTWPNHIKFPFRHGLDVHVAPYLTEAADVNIDGIIELMRSMYNGVVIWPTSPMNPFSKTPDYAMEKIAPVAKKQGHVLMLDISFPGFGKGMETDMSPSMYLVEQNITHIVTVSLSKIFGMPGKRTGFIGIVYGKNEGDTMEEDTLELMDTGESTSTNPDSEASDLIRRVLMNPEYLRVFISEQEKFRASFNRKGSLICESLPEYAKILEGEGPLRCAGSFDQDVWDAVNNRGVFPAPIEDAEGHRAMRFNLTRIPENGLSEFLDRIGPPLLEAYRTKKRSA